MTRTRRIRRVRVAESRQWKRIRTARFRGLPRVLFRLSFVRCLPRLRSEFLRRAPPVFFGRTTIGTLRDFVGALPDRVLIAGHSNPLITLKRYSHLLDQRLTHAASQYDPA